jgi:hypothetical protein
VHDSRGDHTEARGAEALVLKRAVADLALAMGRTPRGAANCWLRPCSAPA